MYLHQWRYKDEQVKPMLVEKAERVDEVRTATEAFGGTLHQFFFCLGDYDGLAIAEFPDDESALACLMTHYTLGRVHSIKSTPLIGPAGIVNAKTKARRVLGLQED
ncbi:GYD domain-containing protein [Ideonella sp.]|uniref:GYD domain-containing protein n=1 Tax=Ideonella sp. TaxID=1929293 RepID=UPI002B459D0A|nr:GYD domain-containing protein [Ideonella sp.]